MIEDGVRVPSFSGISHMKLGRIRRTDKLLTVDIYLKTLNNEGIIFYTAQRDDGSGDYFALVLNDGYVELRYELGSGPAIIRSNNRLGNSHFHHVIASREGKQAKLQVDGKAVIGSSPGDSISLNLLLPAFLGAVPDISERVTLNLGTSSGLVGCIRSLRVVTEHSSLNYSLNYPSSKDVLSAFGISECNPCLSGPCFNGGSCNAVDEENYECQCPEGLSGKLCSEPAADDPCLSLPCGEGATCTPHPNGDIQCICPRGRSGKKCEIDNSPGDRAVKFDGLTRLRYTHSLKESEHGSRHIEIMLKTNQNDAGLVMMYHMPSTATGDYLAMAVRDGKVEISYSHGGRGSKNHSSSWSRTYVSDSRWHSVIIEKEKHKMVLIVDDEEVVSDITQRKPVLHNRDGSLWIGGAHRIPSHLSQVYHRGFQGCVLSILVDGTQLSLTDAFNTTSPIKYC